MVEQRLEGDGEETHVDLWERTFQAEMEASVERECAWQGMFKE